LPFFLWSLMQASPNSNAFGVIVPPRDIVRSAGCLFVASIISCAIGGRHATTASVGIVLMTMSAPLVWSNFQAMEYNGMPDLES